MSNRPFATVGAVLCATLVVVPLTSCKETKMPGPKPDVVKADVKVDMPGVPSFELPPVGPDGSHAVKEMRVRGRKLLDTDVAIHGYVTWAYDCGTAIRQPGWTDLDLENKARHF